MENAFTKKWGEKKDHRYCLIELNTLKTQPIILLSEMKPHQIVNKVVFVVAFESEFRFSLRERKSATLDEAQTDALEVEANFTSTGKSKGRSDHDVRHRGKEEASTSSQDREVADTK